ncbi:hypothetical protein QW131_06580 [Roseibium salinum]|nr:hypothetical protein [Roseibium salinum]
MLFRTFFVLKELSRAFGMEWNAAAFPLIWRPQSWNFQKQICLTVRDGVLSKLTNDKNWLVCFYPVQGSGSETGHHLHVPAFHEEQPFLNLLKPTLENMTREETIIRKARQICAWRIRTFLRSVCAVVAGGLGLAALSGTPAGTQEPVSLQNHILAIGSCPPWHPQSVEICRHSLQEVVSSLAPRVNAGPDKTHLLINEGASAAALKRKATELANKLTPNDRLIIYANLPLGASDITLPSGQTGYVLELWSGQKNPRRPTLRSAREPG